MKTENEELAELCEQMNQLSDELVGCREGGFLEMLAEVKRLKVSDHILKVHQNARSQGTAIKEACENLMAEIEALEE